VIAGDGEGPVNIGWDYNDNTNTPTSTVAAIVNPALTTSATISYTTQLTVPNVTCGTAGCTLMLSSNGWFACASVAINPSGSPVPPTPQSCMVVYGLQFCTSRNGVNIGYTPGTNPVTQTDALTAATYYATYNNTNVFSNGNSQSCQSAYKAYICDSNFPACGQITGCQSLCNAATQACGLSSSHQGLYNCSAAPLTCTGASFSSLAALLLAGALVAVLAAFAF
jgi:hypothetical protein